MTEVKTHWELLHSKLPPAAIKPLATSVYGVAGLSDVNEGYLVQRLFASDLPWEWRVIKQEYLGSEDRPVRDKDYSLRYYMAAVHGELSIDGRIFHGSGASDNRKIDAAFKGANTVAFKNACKWAGLTSELFLDGRAIDHIYQGRVTKDPDMAPASVDRLLSEAIETFGEPEEVSGSDQRQGQGSPPGEATSKQPAAAVTQTPPPAQADGESGISVAQGEAPLSPPAPISSDEELLDLFALARTLEAPPTLVQVQNKVAKNGLAAVRRELFLAHKRDHGPACAHVAELAGLR